MAKFLMYVFDFGILYLGPSNKVQIPRFDIQKLFNFGINISSTATSLRNSLKFGHPSNLRIFSKQINIIGEKQKVYDQLTCVGKNTPDLIF